MDNIIIKWLIDNGTNSVLAALCFYFYRKDVSHFTDLWKGQADLLMKVVVENTIAITKLTDLLTQNGRLRH